MQVFVLIQTFEIEGNQTQGIFYTMDDALAYRDMIVREYFEWDYDHEGVAWPMICEYIEEFAVEEHEVMKVLHKE